MRRAFGELRLGLRVDLTVVGEATHAEEAAAMVQEHEPDVLVPDYTLATRNGTNLLREARVTSPESRCVVLSEKSDEGGRDAAFAVVHGLLDMEAAAGTIAA